MQRKLNFFPLLFSLGRVYISLSISENEYYTFGHFTMKIAFFKRAWQKVKAISCPWVSASKQPHIRTFNRGTTLLSTKGPRSPRPSKFKHFYFSPFPIQTQTFFGLATQQLHIVPHLKAPICGCFEAEVQGRGNTFTLCHTLLKMNKVLYSFSETVHL